MFTPSLKTCLHHVLKLVYTLCETCLSNICTLLKEMFTQWWKTWLHHILKTFFNPIWKHLFVSCIMFKGMLCYAWRHVYTKCVHTMLVHILRQNWGHLLSKFWSPFHSNLLKIVFIVEIGVFGLKIVQNQESTELF